MKNSFYMIFVLFCLLAGCMTQSIAPANIYTISPEWSDSRAQAEREKKSPLIIKLAPVRATRAFTGTEIIYTDARHGRNSYAHSRWSDTPVRLLQTLFQVALEENGRFGAVVPPTSASKADLLLEITLFDFSHHINDDGTSDGVVRVCFYLIDNTTKTVMATKEFASRVSASSQNARSAATALNKAATNVAHDLASWLAEPGRF
ncbi:MAG: membrane integrity-associated transporter subunit PqiC [Desulfosarcina sp.]|nr:membrane integrity-associated transporter subunit PqiC [Desulfobacterales bacterium]